MANADTMRASDADRERVVQALQVQVGEGRLTLPEFEERAQVAYAARTVGELRRLTADLPIELFPAQVWPSAAAPGTPVWPVWSPMAPRARPPGRPMSLWLLIPVLLIAAIVLSDVIAALVWGATAIVPAVILVFVLLRIAGFRRR